MGAGSRAARGAGACHYCGRRVFPAGSPEVLADRTCLATRDHVVPQIWRDPGVRSTANIVTACQGCNGVKGDRPVEIFEWFAGQTRGTPRFTAAELNKLVFGLALAGFKTATRDALAQRPPEPPCPVPAGRFNLRDLRRKRSASRGAA